MPQMKLVEAINDALRVEMRRDARVVVLGEDVGRFGGGFRATVGLQEEFGLDRCIDTPLAESGIVGTAIGLALYGMRPVPEIQFGDYVYPAYDQIVQGLSVNDFSRQPAVCARTEEEQLRLPDFDRDFGAAALLFPGLSL